jgi:hypothetical protein
MATAVTHYTSYKARPFTREQRDKTTILFGGLTWKHERLVQGVFNNLNYNAKTAAQYHARGPGRRQGIDRRTGACCPTIFTTGSLVNFLKTEVATNGKQKTLDDYVFLTAGACGPCRFGQYHESYEMALDGMGLKDFRLSCWRRISSTRLRKRAAAGNQYAAEPRHCLGHSGAATS